MWDAVKVNGSIYGVPSYKEMGWQGGIVYNSDMAEAYGIDMSAVKTLEDYTKVLETVAAKIQSRGQKRGGRFRPDQRLAHGRPL